MIQLCWCIKLYALENFSNNLVFWVFTFGFGPIGGLSLGYLLAAAENVWVDFLWNGSNSYI